MGNEGSGIFGFINMVGDIVFLNLIFIITCIPVVTIGPSLVALYTVTGRIAEGSEGYVIRSYFKAFKDNIYQGMVVGVLLEVICCLLATPAVVFYKSASESRTIGFMLAIIAVIFVLAVTMYIFPLMAGYNSPIATIIKNAALIALGRLPYTIMLLIITIIPVIAVLITRYALIYVIFGAFSVGALIKSKIIKKIFAKI